MRFALLSLWPRELPAGSGRLVEEEDGRVGSVLAARSLRCCVGAVLAAGVGGGGELLFLFFRLLRPLLLEEDDDDFEAERLLLLILGERDFDL